MVVKEEQNNVECSNESKNLQNELVFPNNDSNVVNGDEVNRGFEEVSNELGEDSNSTNIKDSAEFDTGEKDKDDSSINDPEKLSGSEVGEIDKDDSSINDPEKLSGSEAGEIDKDDNSINDPEKLSESEAGEIDKDDNSINDSGRLSGSEAGEIDKEEPCDVEDGEISESVEKKTVCRFFLRGNCYYGSQCQFLHMSDKIYKMFDLQTLSNGSKNAPSLPPQVSPHPVEASSSWENGLKTAKAMIQDSIKKRNEDTEFENKKLYISPEVTRSDKVYSRDKESESKCRTSEEKAEPVKDLRDIQERKKEKQSTSNKDISNCEYKWVDPWMRLNKKDSKAHTSKRKRKRHSSISSASSLDNTVMNPKPSPKKRLSRKSSPQNSRYRSYSRSRSWSRTRVSYSTHNHSRKNSPTYRKSKRNKARSSSLEKWYKKEVSTARHSRSPSPSSLDSFRSNESSMTISSLSCSHTSSCSSSPDKQTLKPSKRDKNPLVSNVSSPFPVRPRIATSFMKNIQSHIHGKQKGLNQKDVSLKQRVVSSKQTKVTIPEVKTSNKPLVKLTLKKKSPALMELLKYTNIKPKGKSSVIGKTSAQQASKFQDLDSSSSDCKGVVSTNPRRNITLNLQTPKSLKQKIPEVQIKQFVVPEISNKEVISKKESLLKQLRLVEQAIARKKNSC